jgi:hypothetical protein
MQILVFLLLAITACSSGSPEPAPARALFNVQSNFWVNLHHFARAAGRGMPTPADLTPAERIAWDAGVAFYHDHYSSRSLYLDGGMAEINNTLGQTPGDSTLGNAPLDSELKSTLASLAPIYRTHWWPAHNASNRAWIQSVQPLVRLYGETLSQRVADSYGQQWPAEPIPVDVSVEAGPVGAYTTSPPTHVTMSSIDPSYRGLAALEMLFHETSHAWGRFLQNGINKAAEAQNKEVPPQLWHAVLFYNAGELTRRTLAENGVSDYVEYAVKHKVYPELCGEGCRDRVAESWDRHLAGNATVESALESLVTAWPANERSKPGS